MLLSGDWKSPAQGKKPFFPALTPVFLAAAALFAGNAFGGDPVTPDSPLYVEKMADEQLAVTCEEDPAARSSLCLDFAAERIRELKHLCAKGEFQHADSLLQAWRILAISGALKTAQQASSIRRDMRAVFPAIAARLDEFAVSFEALASRVPEDRKPAFLAAAGMARASSAESREAAAREEERVARHEAMLDDSARRIREGLEARGFSPEEAIRASERIRAECRFHGSLRAELAVAVMTSGGELGAPAEKAALAAQANALAEAGVSEKQALGTALFLTANSYTAAETLRLMRDLERVAAKGGADRGKAAAGAVRVIFEAADRGGRAADAGVMLRNAGRLIDQGVPPSMVFEEIANALKSVREKNPDSVREAIEKGLAAAEEIRDRLVRKAKAELDRLKGAEGTKTE